MDATNMAFDDETFAVAIDKGHFYNIYIIHILYIYYVVYVYILYIYIVYAHCLNPNLTPDMFLFSKVPWTLSSARIIQSTGSKLISRRFSGFSGRTVII